MKAFAIATAASGSTRVPHHERTADIQISPLKTAIATNLLTPAKAVASTPHLDKTPPTTTMASIPGKTTSEDEFHFLRLTSPSTEEGREAVVANMTVLRVLNVARHWITKYPEVGRRIFHFLDSGLLECNPNRPNYRQWTVTISSDSVASLFVFHFPFIQDFDCDVLLKSKMQVLLEELLHNPRLNVSNRKVAFQLSKEMLNDQLVESHVDLDILMTPLQVSLFFIWLFG